MQGAMRVLLCAAIVLLACAGAVTAHEPPRLMLDTGGHMGPVFDVAFTPDGKNLISAGHDKVIRVWDWQAGRTVRMLRGEVGPGDEGRIFAIAISPDGRRLAAAGQMAAPGQTEQRIRIYDLATGELVQLLAGHTGKIVALAYAPDGTRLLSGSQDRTALLWDLSTGRPVHRLRHNAEIYGVAFTPDGARVVTGSFDRTLRLWRVTDGRSIAEMRGHGEKIRALAVSPRDGSVASGSFDGEIRLWDGRTGRLLRPLANQGGAQVGSLSFSPDGRWLVSTCGGGQNCAQQPQSVWDVGTGRLIKIYGRHDNVTLASATSPDGRLVVTAGGDNNEIHVWDAQTGETRQVLRGTGAPIWGAGFAADGASIAWGHIWLKYDPAAGYGPLQWQLRLPQAGPGTNPVLGRPERLAQEHGETYTRARVRHGPHTLTHGKGGGYGLDDAILRIARSGKAVADIKRGLADGLSHRAYSFSPDGKTIVSGGSNGYLAAYDLRGRREGNFIGHESDVWAVATSSDGRLLVSGAQDQTLRLWNLATRELIVTLFHGTDGEWVLWTPQGYYTGSPGADRFVGWQINKGPRQAAEYVGAAQLRQHLYRPDIVEKAIILGSAEQAVREAPGTKFALDDLLARPVPSFRILAPSPGSTERGGRAVVRIRIAATPDPVRSIRVQVNGRQVDERTPDVGSGGFGPGEHDLDVPLATGRNEVRISLTNAVGENAETLTLSHEGDGALDVRGTLHILAIGVNDYKGLGASCGEAGCDLRYPVADARRLGETIERRLGPGHSRVAKRVLVNGGDAGDAPTAANIIDAVELLRQAKETDTIVLFIAGHGLNDGPDYRFIPTDAEWSAGALRGSRVVPWQVLQSAVEAAKGRRLLFVDTCHSGNAYNQRLGNAAYHANIIAYTAARFDQYALEDARLGHGLFTYALVEGLEGGGSAAAGRQLTTADLAEYVAKRVDELAKGLNGEQEPQYFKGRDAEDYVLARW
jgi:WD40 repeat protein